MFDNHIVRWLRITVAVVLIVGTFLINPSYNVRALAADSYSAATDTYQETRNPNRVNSTREELANSELDLPEARESDGESIYERVVDRVNQQRDSAIKGTSNTQTKSEP